METIRLDVSFIEDDIPSWRAQSGGKVRYFYRDEFQEWPNVWDIAHAFAYENHPFNYRILSDREEPEYKEEPGICTFFINVY